MIERKKKICKICKEPQFIWARGCCKSCDYKENPPKKIDRTKRKETGELEFMKMVWEASAHNCQECGVYLPEFSPYYMAHILSKGAAPEHRLNPSNIIILCVEHHNQLDGGDKTKMKIFKMVMNTIMSLKKSQCQ